jgi:hypothetical protein
VAIADLRSGDLVDDEDGIEYRYVGEQRVVSDCASSESEGDVNGMRTGAERPHLSGSLCTGAEVVDSNRSQSPSVTSSRVW